MDQLHRDVVSLLMMVMKSKKMKGERMKTELINWNLKVNMT